MAYRDLRPLAFIIYAGFLVFLADARTWDLAVAIGKDVNFFTSNGTFYDKMETREIFDLSGIAYDDYTHTMFLSTTNKNSNLTIFSTNLTIKEFTMQKLLKNERRSHIIGLVYDSQTQNLFWSDRTENVIMSLHVPSNKSGSGEPKVLLKLPHKDPRGISLDACNRRLYWANSNTSDPSIESSNLDGSDRITVIKTDLHQPMGVALDHWSAKLYWIDDDLGDYYKIGRSNLDGSNRELLVHRLYQQPYNLAVDRNAIYWSDWTNNAIVTIKKDAKDGEEPKSWFSFQDDYRETEVKSILARDNIGEPDCAAMFEAERKNLAGSRRTDTTEEENYNNVITSTEVGDSITKISSRCFNDGNRNEATDTCNCKLGFDGPLCERSVCHNYCLHGECYVTAGGQPRCKCSPSYQGQRCESNICDGYCLNSGQCSIKNSEPFCTCKSTSGPRCENQYDMAEICTIFCASKLPALSSIDTSSCRCPNENKTVVEASTCSEDQWYKTLVIALSALLGVLTIVVGVLSYYVNKLRRRPRIRKRFVVSKAGITPLTARPQLPSDQCEIMIENCCNMNICETPCFEPKLRSGEQSAHKRDEKNSLLNNMEGNFC